MDRRLRELLQLLEALWYEASPYVYAVVGLASVLVGDSAPGFLFSVLLVAVAVAILRLRRSHRSPQSRHYRKYARPR